MAKPTTRYNHRIKFYPWILDALIRDGFKCVDCGFDDKYKLLVHHVDNCRKTGKLNNNIENLVTLCRSCHAKRHKIEEDSRDIVELKEMGMSFTQIGEVWGISRQRAHQIYKKKTST